MLHICRSRWGRRLAPVLLAGWMLAGAAGCGGCADSDSTERAPAKEPGAQEESAEQRADQSMEQQRSVFGLPLPPSVRRIDQEGDEVRVKTDMSLKEVGAFFEARLTDYEILYPADEVRAVPLRDYMPQVYAYPYGHYSFLVYMPAAKEPEARAEQADAPKAGAQAADGQSKSGASKRSGARGLSSRKRGEPVLDRTSSGELLAPGARWGEPYTPPPGSPLDKKHFRSNFGRPYGEWVAQ